MLDNNMNTIYLDVQRRGCSHSSAGTFLVFP